MRRPLAQPLAKFFADRGTHLAAMIAYFGLLSSVSLIFLALALLGFTGRAEESSYLVEELQRLFPSQSIGDIVRVVEAITENATTLGVIGGAFLLWTSLSLFSVLESAFNIVYGKPNRAFLHGKGLATLFMAGSLMILFLALVVGSIGFDVLKRFAPGFVSNGVVAYSLSVLLSTSGRLRLPRLGVRAADERAPDAARGWPGAALGAVLLQVTFQTLPIFVRLSREVIAVQALGASALLLVWLYVMSNVIVFGAEVNWWLAQGRRERRRDRRPGLTDLSRGGPRLAGETRFSGRCGCEEGRAARARWELRRFQSFAELGDRPRLAGRDEDRVVAEPLLPLGVVASAPSRIPVPRSSAVRRQSRRARRRSARAGPSTPVELLRAAARRRRPPSAPTDPGPAAERRRLDPGVLADQPHLRLRPPTPEDAPWRARSRSSVAPVLGRIAVGVQELELPAGQRRPELLELVPFREHSRALTAATGAARRRQRRDLLRDPRGLGAPRASASDDVDRPLVAELDRVDDPPSSSIRVKHARGGPLRREVDHELASSGRTRATIRLLTTPQRPERDEHERGRPDRDHVVARPGRHPDRGARPRASPPSSGRAR